MFSPKIVAFLCTWCSYAGADLAGTGRNQYPPNIRVIRIPCSGRINPIYIIKALLEGADGVMVSGCHPGDCHYLVGNYYARRRFVVLKKLLTTAGFDPDRIHFTWVSASEGARFSDVIKEVTEKVTALGPAQVGDIAALQAMVSVTTQTTVSATPQATVSVTSQAAASVTPKTTVSACSPAQTAEYGQAAERSNPDTPQDMALWHKQQEELIPLCKKLLADGSVNTIVGFQKGGETGMSLPYIFSSPEEADKLVWNARCVPVLSGYPVEIKGKTAVVAKPCDARALVSLINENQLKRDDVYIIGLVCGGLVSDEGKPLPACADCKVYTPPVYDALIGDEASVSGMSEKSPSVQDIDSKREPCPSVQHTDSERKPHSSPQLMDNERFADEMNKCILCFSCRQSCYGCYCKTCFIDRGEPDWQTASPGIGAKMLYHLGRTTHLSGRCVECGACENACASGVDIRYLIKEVTRFIEETYDFRTGMDPETDPVMLTYKTDDLEIGFLGDGSEA